MMRKEYEIPEFVIYHFESDSVITTSFGENEIKDEWDTTVPEVSS